MTPSYAVPSTIPLVRYGLFLLVQPSLICAAGMLVLGQSHHGLLGAVTLGVIWGIYMFAMVYRAQLVSRYEVHDESIRFVGPLGTHTVRFEDCLSFGIDAGGTPVNRMFAVLVGLPKKRLSLTLGFFRWGLAPRTIYVAEPDAFLEHLQSAYANWKQQAGSTNAEDVWPQRPF